MRKARKYIKLKRFIQCILFTLLLFSGCRFTPEYGLRISPAKGFPKWLRSGNIHTDQTSGITFIKTDSAGSKHFLLADDTGELHRLTIQNDTLIILSKIYLSSNILSFLSTLPRPDFEEILYDQHERKVYLAIEGHIPKINEAGIYRISFSNDNALSDSVVSIEKVNIVPVETFMMYISENIGFEGLAADENYFYVGLEGFASNSLFADSTILYVVSKKDLTIKQILNTKDLGISTICGLYSDKNNTVTGVDRNKKKIFKIVLNDNLEIIKFMSEDLRTNIPEYPELQYAVSFEGLTLDDENNVYLVDDPWKKFFIPSQEVQQLLDEETGYNFKNFIPVLYKYKIQ